MPYVNSDLAGLVIIAAVVLPVLGLLLVGAGELIERVRPRCHWCGHRFWPRRFKRHYARELASLRDPGPTLPPEARRQF